MELESKARSIGKKNVVEYLLLGVRHSNRDWVFEENGVARDMPRRGNRNTWLLRLLITTE